jgi:hypothetical protein
MNVRLAISGIAGIAVMALAGCGTAATQHAGSAPSSRPSASASAGLVQRQRAASQNAINVLAQDNAARSAFESRWAAINFNDPTTIGTQLAIIGRFADGLKASPQLHSAMDRLIGDTYAYYFATKHVPTQAQIQADANAVATVQ